MAKLIHQLQAQYKRHYRAIVAFVVGLIIAISFGLFTQEAGNEIEYASLGREASSSEVSPAVATTSLPSLGMVRSAPIKLRIPTINLETEFEGELGLNEDKTVQVPDSFEKVGWYKYGPTPGEVGPAVVLGHVDSYEGPAIFYSLGQLKDGDQIFIDRADGETVTFVVDHLERHEQSDFPTKEVYGDLDYPGLRLVTCTGIYSHSSLRYSHNLIVFAKLAEPQARTGD